MCKKLTTFLHDIEKLYSLLSVAYVLNLFTLNTKILLKAIRHQRKDCCKILGVLTFILCLLLVSVSGARCDRGQFSCQLSLKWPEGGVRLRHLS